MRLTLLFLAAVVACAGTDVDSFAGMWRGDARLWLGPAKPQRIVVEVNVEPGGAVAGRIGGARCLHGQLRNRTWWQVRSFNHYEMRIDCRLDGELVAGVVRERGTVALNVAGPHLKGWFFSEGHDGFPLFPATQARADGLVLQRTGSTR